MDTNDRIIVDSLGKPSVIGDTTIWTTHALLDRLAHESHKLQRRMDRLDDTMMWLVEREFNRSCIVGIEPPGLNQDPLAR